MSLWRQLTRGLRGLFRQSRADDDIAAEIRQYLDDATAAGLARGLSIDEARRAAREELGNTAAVQEQVRSYGWENAVRSLRLRSALRLAPTAQQSRVSPSVSVVTLALGIGASTAIFSAVNPILFSPLPYPHPSRILMIWNTWHGARFELSFGTYRELLERSRSFESMAIFEPWQPTSTGDRSPERLEGQSVSASFFRVLGVAPEMGRDFLPSEEGRPRPQGRDPQRSPVAASFSSRSQPSSAAPSSSTTTTTPSSASCPLASKTSSRASAEIWTPAQYDPSQLATEFRIPGHGSGVFICASSPASSRASPKTRPSTKLLQIARTPLPDYPRPALGLARTRSHRRSAAGRRSPTPSSPRCWPSPAP